MHHDHPAPTTSDTASILIVDDQRFDRRRLRGLCGALPFTTQIVEADSLAALRAHLTKERFDLVLMDHHLTDGTGLDGVAHIRADPTNKDAAVVMITGTEERDVAGRALSAGFSDYLSKDDLTEQSLTKAALAALFTACGKSLPARTRASCGCAHDIKPIISRMMRQMRDLRDLDALPLETAGARVAQVEGSLRRLWAFLEDLEDTGAKRDATDTHARPGQDASGRSGQPRLRLNPGPVGEAARTAPKPPSVFRRRPD